MNFECSYFSIRPHSSAAADPISWLNRRPNQLRFAIFDIWRYQIRRLDYVTSNIALVITRRRVQTQTHPGSSNPSTPTGSPGPPEPPSGPRGPAPKPARPYLNSHGVYYNHRAVLYFIFYPLGPHLCGASNWFNPTANRKATTAAALMALNQLSANPKFKQSDANYTPRAAAACYYCVSTDCCRWR